MLHRVSVPGFLSILLFLVPPGLLSQIPDSTMYPKTIFKRWNFVTQEECGEDGAGDDEYMEIDDLYEYRHYAWDDAKTELLRRFDMLMTGAVHILSFDDTNVPADDYKVFGLSLNHSHFDTTYDHDAAHGGSQQSLLGKSKIPWLRVNAEGDSLEQLILGAADPFKVHHSYLRNRLGWPTGNINSTSIKRELGDWIAPTWFALGRGGFLVDSLAADSTDNVVYVEGDSLYRKFFHACAGDSTNPLCADTSNHRADKLANVWKYSFVTVIPDTDYTSYEDEISDCFDNPDYEIMMVDLTTLVPSGGGVEFEVVRAFRGGLLGHPAGSQVRPLVFTNTNNWGSLAYVMNLCTTAPKATVNDSGPYGWYDLAALWVANHHLKSWVTIKNIYDAPLDSFYLCDGLRLDGYTPEPDEMSNQPRMLMHSENIDLDLDGDFDFPAYDSTIAGAWKGGYSKYLKNVRDSTKAIRGDSTAFIILPNGTPDTTHYKYINGKYWEDTNGKFQDQDPNWEAVIATTENLSVDPRIVEPRYLVYQERARGLPDSSKTNIKQMRLTLATSLLFTDDGVYGTTGRHEARSPVFRPGYYQIEDYQDEFAVEDSCYGVWHDAFPKEWVPYPDPTDTDTVPILDPDTLFTAVHYLGAPLDTAKTYFLHSYSCDGDTCHDILYREFDHGVVFAHYGACAIVTQDEGEGGGEDYVPYQWIHVNLDSIDLENDPRDDGYHFIGIGGCNLNGFKNPWNDSTNVRQHDFNVLELWRYGGGRIILKEGDGFLPWHLPDQD